MTRRSFLQHAAGSAAALAVPFLMGATAGRPDSDPKPQTPNPRPNIILVMCDDLGYGDVGFNGGKIIQTPYLDRMCGEGARFTRFHAGGPVCSPTRGTCLTGRHYLRYGITHANEGMLPRQEITIAEIARAGGYRTGHFGKWHLGTLTKTGKDSNRGGAEHPELYSPPWDHGFDTCFSTEAMVPTWNPAVVPAERDNQWGVPGEPWKGAYWNERGERVRENLDGDDARVIMDRVEPFIRACAHDGQPALAVVWFHTPHAPVVAGPDYRATYAQHPEAKQHYYGAVSAVDDQIGRLNALLKELNIEDDTMIWFASDNGPEGRGDGALDLRFHGETGGLRGRKRSLYNGGTTVPAFVKWPARIAPSTTYTMPCSTLDYLPTIAEVLGYTMPDARPVDGVSLLPLLRGQSNERAKPIPFCFPETKQLAFGAPTLALIDNRYKLLTNLSKPGAEDEVYDLVSDPFEQKNLLGESAEIAKRLRSQLMEFVASCRASHTGADYPEPFTPIAPFQEPTGDWKK